MRFLSILIIFLGISVGTVYGQCEIDAKAVPSVICEGDSLKLKSYGACNFLMNNDFNNYSLGIGWSNTGANPVFTNPCGPGPDSAHAWVGTTPSNTRTLETQTYNVSIGNCRIEFWMRYGIVPDAGNCEDPDAQNEGVHLQYSVNNGAWQDFPGPIINPQGNNTTTPPFNTYVDGSGGYWAPLSSLADQQNSSLYYWNKYSCTVPAVASTTNTRFRWAQLATSSTGYDAWGIDEVEILCPDTTTYVEWKDELGNVFAHDLIGGYVSPTHSQWYYVTITDSASGYFATDSVYVTVNPIPDNQFTVSNLTPCQGDSVTISYNGQMDTNATYNWTINPDVYNVFGPFTKTLVTTDSVPVSLYVEALGCTSPVNTQTIQVSPKPLLSFMPDVFNGCEPLTVNFQNSSSPMNSQFLWSFGDGNSDVVASPTHTYTSPGVYDISINASTQAGCVDSLTLPNIITVYASPIADFVVDNYTVSFKSPTVNITNNSVNPDSCHWDFGDGQTFDGVNPGSHTFPGEGTYTICVDVYSSDGCFSKMCRDVRVVVDEVKVPNIITPNGDGQNDALIIDNIQGLKSARLVIYNRWGKKIYESLNYQNDWDAENHSDGVYFWTLDYTTLLHDEVTLNGTLTVMRE